MPRQSRIDAPGALQHIIARGIERKKIFTDGVDRDNFLNRLGNILTQTQTACFSWALIPNHFHFGRVAESLDLKPEQVLTVGKYKKTVAARSLLCFWAKSELGISQSELGQISADFES